MSAVSNNLLDAMNGPTGTNNTNQAGNTGLNSNSAADTQARFLTLLTTQLQNQDPTNPMDNSALTTQIAQLSTVTGIEQLNASMGALMASLQNGQTMQAAALIGHGVLAPGNSTQLSTNTTKADDGTETSTHTAIFGGMLANAADDVKITVRDSDGNVVDSIDMGKQPAGIMPVVWDGTKSDGTVAPDGTYTFEIEATNASGPVQVLNLSFGTVASITNGPTGSRLNVTNIGAIGLNDIVQIL
jgi:flagellar basal-body rod modification protein FlgD